MQEFGSIQAAHKRQTFRLYTFLLSFGSVLSVAHIVGVRVCCACEANVSGQVRLSTRWLRDSVVCPSL